MRLRRRDLSFAVIVFSATLVGIHLVGALSGDWFASTMAMRPAEVLAAIDGGAVDARQRWALATVLLSMLAHADVEHLASNLGFFWLFGTLLSQLAGDRWVILGLILTQISAGAAYVAYNAGTEHLVIGASGAISGVAGLYVVLAFRWDAADVYAWPLARPVPPVQAALAAIIFAAVDVYVLSDGIQDGVAHIAHVGGFGGGLLLGAILTTFFPTLERFRRSPFGPATAGGA